MEHPTASQRIAAAVADAIKRADLSQRDVAARTGIPLVTLSRRLTGKSPFTIAELATIADLLGTTIAGLTAAADTPAVA